MSVNRPAGSEHLFLLLLRLFPRSFRARFGNDMRDLFRDQRRAALTRAGLRGVARLWATVVPSLVYAALLERRDARRTRRALAAAHTTATSGSDSMLETTITDLRFAARMLWKNPVFTVVAIVCIALGSGAVTTIFSATNALLLRPLPGAANPDRVVVIERRVRDGGESLSASYSYSYYSYLRDRSHALTGLAAWSKAPLSIAFNGEGSEATGTIVSGNYFDVLGVRPALGRFFTPDEDRTELTHPVIVVSDGFWRTRMGADPSVIGKTVGVNSRPYTVVGVAPPGFRGVFTPLVTDAWVPLMMQRHVRPRRDLTDARWLRVFGRLREGMTREAAQRELATLADARAADRSAPATFGVATTIRLTGLTGLPEDASGPAYAFMGLLLAAAALVLLIASVNVASMLSARSISRRREMAVRLALGAGRRRLVRQLLTETILLFLLGAGGGLMLAIVATGALEQLPLVAGQAIALELSPDARVFAFALALSLLTGLVFGLAPALQATGTNISTRLRNDSAPAGGRRTLFSQTLVVGQMALSLLLLVAAGLFLRALDRGQRVDPGFTLTGVSVAALNSESWGYDPARGQAFFPALREQLTRIPGVTAVSYSAVVPLSMASSGEDIHVDSNNAATRVPIQTAIVDADYFTVLRLPLVRGRAINEQDTEHSAKVAVVNETLARRSWPDGSALGRIFVYRGDRVTIVGIARNAKYASLSEEMPAFAYFPLSQFWQPAQVLLVRADATGLPAAIYAAMRSIDPAVPRPQVVTLTEATSVVLLVQRVAAMVTGALGGVGLLLATVGLYGITAYSVSRRTREIGIRMALGAHTADVTGMIVRGGLRLALLGVAIGLLLAAGATRLLAAYLFNVSPLDAATFGGMSALFVGVSFVASYLPARRAAAADPMAALRADP